MDHALELLPADYWRWWITAKRRDLDAHLHLGAVPGAGERRPGRRAGQLRQPHLQVRESRFEGKVPRAASWGDLERKLAADVTAKLAELTGPSWRTREFRKSAAALRQIWVLGQRLPDEARPGRVQDRPERAGVACAMGLNLVALFARCRKPFIPFAAEKIAERWARRSRPLAVADGRACWTADPGRPIAAPEVLFRKVENEQVAEWRARFGGPEGDAG
jgi:methionyl-tRNA synthetase